MKRRILFHTIFISTVMLIAGISWLIERRMGKDEESKAEITAGAAIETMEMSKPNICNSYQTEAGDAEVKNGDSALSYYEIIDGILYGYGDNSLGQLGLGRIDIFGEVYYSDPVYIDNHVIHVDVHVNGTVIYINEDHELYGIGQNYSGQLGQSIEGKNRLSTESSVTTPILIERDVKYAVVGLNFILILKQDGSLYAIGDNANGQLGDGTAKPVRGERYDASSTPYSDAPVFVMDHVAFIACSSYSAAAITENGQLWMWGDNSFGEIGNGEKGNGFPTVSTYVVSKPFKVMSQVKSVIFEEGTVYAIDFNGEEHIWGKGYT